MGNRQNCLKFSAPLSSKNTYIYLISDGSISTDSIFKGPFRLKAGKCQEDRGDKYQLLEASQQRHEEEVVILSTKYLRPASSAMRRRWWFCVLNTWDQPVAPCWSWKGRSSFLLLRAQISSLWIYIHKKFAGFKKLCIFSQKREYLEDFWEIFVKFRHCGRICAQLCLFAKMEKCICSILIGIQELLYWGLKFHSFFAFFRYFKHAFLSTQEKINQIFQWNGIVQANTAVRTRWMIIIIWNVCPDYKPTFNFWMNALIGGKTLTWLPYSRSIYCMYCIQYVWKRYPRLNENSERKWRMN
jgi:hypothetical protein